MGTAQDPLPDASSSVAQPLCNALEFEQCLLDVAFHGEMDHTSGSTPLLINACVLLCIGVNLGCAMIPCGLMQMHWTLLEDVDK